MSHSMKRTNKRGTVPMRYHWGVAAFCKKPVILAVFLYSICMQVDIRLTHSFSSAIDHELNIVHRNLSAILAFPVSSSDCKPGMCRDTLAAQKQILNIEYKSFRLIQDTCPT